MSATAWHPRKETGPVLIQARRTEPWGLATAFAVLVTVAVALGGARWADVGIGLGFIACFALFMVWVTRLRNRVWVRFDGWDVTVHPAIGRERTFDARQVAGIHWRGVADTAHRTYQIKVRAPEGERPLRLGVPVTLVRDPTRALDELLSRVAAAEPVPKADKRTAKALEGWRRYGAGPSPPIRDVPRGGD